MSPLRTTVPWPLNIEFDYASQKDTKKLNSNVRTLWLTVCPNTHTNTPIPFGTYALLSGRPENKERPVGSVRKAHDAAIDRAGVEDFRLYDLRHTFATRAAQAGVDVLTLAALLGHTTVQMTSRYVHPTDAHKADAAKKLETYNAQLVAEMIERQRKVSTISTTVN
jgi:integrase